MPVGRADGILLHDHVNMGIAIAVNDGVVAAVVRNAHTASLAEIAIQRRDVADRARAGKLRPADISDATFTISNLGMYQVDQFSAIITPPQAAILAVGGIADRVVAVQGQAGGSADDDTDDFMRSSRRRWRPRRAVSGGSRGSNSGTREGREVVLERLRMCDTAVS